MTRAYVQRNEINRKEFFIDLDQDIIYSPPKSPNQPISKLEGTVGRFQFTQFQL